MDRSARRLSLVEPSPEPGERLDFEAALAAVARGDRYALKAIYDAERSWLMGVALRVVRRRELAEEVLQDAFLQIWSRAATFDPASGSARGWIYTVVRHRALDLVRAAGNRPELVDAERFDALLADHAAWSAAETAAAQAAGPDAHTIAQCLERLDEAKRHCVLLAFVEGYSHEEVAAQLRTPLGTVKSWIRRGLIALKECLA